MTSEQLAPFNKWVKKRLMAASCALLYLNHLCRGKKLRVFDVFYNDVIVLKGNTIDVLWSVKGCHKIKIGQLGVIPGHVKGITIPYEKCALSFEIVFYGVNEKVKSKIKLPESCSVEITDAFNAIPTSALKRNLSIGQNLKGLRFLERSIISQVPFQGVEMRVQLPQPGVVWENFPVSHELPKLVIHLPEYKQEDYPKL